jgi:hypothetical protein
MRAALRSDREKRFGHDLDPLEGGGAPRHRSSANGWRGECAPKQLVLGATASFPGVLNKGLGFDWLPP